MDFFSEEFKAARILLQNTAWCAMLEFQMQKKTQQEQKWTRERRKSPPSKLQTLYSLITSFLGWQRTTCSLNGAIMKSWGGPGHTAILLARCTQWWSKAVSCPACETHPELGHMLQEGCVLMWLCACVCVYTMTGWSSPVKLRKWPMF